MSAQTITKLSEKVEKIAPVATKAISNHQKFLKSFLRQEKENNQDLRDLLDTLSTQQPSDSVSGTASVGEDVQPLLNTISQQKVAIEQLTDKIEELQEENNLAVKFLKKLDKNVILAALGGGAAAATIPSMMPGEGGKVIEYLTGDVTSPGYRSDHAGGNYHDHIAFESRSARDQAANWLRSKGWHIGSMNDGKHADGSYHYSNQAFDIPFYPNQRIKGVTDDRTGETKLSSMLRADLAAGGFSGSGIKPAVATKPQTTPAQALKSTSSGQKVAVVQQPTSDGVNRTGGSEGVPTPPTSSSKSTNFLSVMQFHNIQ